MVGTIVIIALASLVIFVVTQPHKKQKFDQTVRFVKRSSIVISFILNIVYWSCIGVLIYIITYGINGYHKLGHLLMSNENFNKAASSIVVPKNIVDQIASPIIVGLLIAIVLFGIIVYFGYIYLAILITQIIAYKQQAQDPYLNRLTFNLKELRSNKYGSAYFNAVTTSYFEMKNNNSKGKLYLEQWLDIVQILLLIGEKDEAERLNHYIFEREKYCLELEIRLSSYLKLNSVYKIGLYDYKQLSKDKEIASRRTRKQRNCKKENNS